MHSKARFSCTLSQSIIKHLQSVCKAFHKRFQSVFFRGSELRPAEINYTTGEQELLAVAHALKIWRCYLEGPHFTVVTDHKPLEHLPSQPNLSGRQIRWSEYLQRFDFDWVYKPGASNLAADALSRNPTHKICSPVAAAMLMILTRSKAKSIKANASPSDLKPKPSKSRRVTFSDPYFF